MKLEVVTLFPEFVASVRQYGIVRRAVEAGLVEVTTRDLREYSGNRWRRVDARPYGGGPGMVLEAGVVCAALDAARGDHPQARVIGLSPQGEPLSQRLVQRLSVAPGLVLLCGRYEGWDERVAGALDLEVSLGDFVLSGGELAAMALVDAVTRLVPGALGDEDSSENDSFSDGWLDHPQYTRPESWRGQGVPEVLLSGDHAAVRRWRLKQALGATWLKRPELLDDLELDEEKTMLLREYIAEHGEGQRSGT